MQLSQPLSKSKPKHIVLTSHPGRSREQPPRLHWGEIDPLKRRPIIGTVTNLAHRNVIGTHSGSYSVYRALAVASGALHPNHRADLTNTAPVVAIGPHPSWANPNRIVSLDPFGGMVGDVYANFYEQGYDIRPTIAVTQAHVNLPEIQEAIQKKRLSVDGKIVKPNGSLVVTKVAIDPVWYLPGIAHRLNVEEGELRRALFQQTGGMFPELVTRPDLQVFLPPIGGITAYLIGEVDAITDPNRQLTVRVHDECNGSDVFGSDICTCRPYLVHGLEVCVQTAQAGGAGVLVYFRKEGRALGEVTKFLVYNARKRQEGGDRADAYFNRTECVAGAPDMRFQELMPDVLHWLGVTRIDSFVSMSDMKYNAITNSGIEIVKRIPIPDNLIPEDAMVEIAAKQAAGYYTETTAPDAVKLATIKGRSLG